MAKGATAGSAFLTGVLAKLPPEDRVKGEAALETLRALGGGTVVAAVGDGVLAQEEFSRQADQLRTQKETLDAQQADLDSREAGLTDWKDQLTDWHTRNKAAIQEAHRLKAGGAPTPGADPVKKVDPPVGVLTEEQYQERQAQEHASILGFARDQNVIQRQHFAKFGEIVDLEPLIRHPQVATLGLLGVYDLVHKDRLAAHTEKTAKDAEEKIRADERQKVQAANAQMPYLTPTGVGSGSPLDALKPAGNQPVVDAAVLEYNRIIAERGAVSR